MNELIQQVRVIDPVLGTDTIADLLICQGIIQAIAAPENPLEIPPNTTVIDGRGLIVGAGLVDLYSHSGEPGFEERETIASLAAAAQAGGFTRIAILPDTTPAIDSPATLNLLQTKLDILNNPAGKVVDNSDHSDQHLPSNSPKAPQFYFWGALTHGVQGEQMTEMAELAAVGIVGFADGQPIANFLLVRRLLEYLQPLHKPIALALGDRSLESGGVAREGLNSLTFGLAGNPHLSETTYLAALLEIIATIPTPVHIMGISTRRGVELIAEAKDRGLSITASTTWLHLICHTQDLATYDPGLRLQPPLGELEDQQALITGIKTGVLDAIAINHTPYTYAEKTVAFSDAPPGAIGLELALPLLWQHLVATEKLTPLQLWQSLSTKPAQCLHQSLSPITPNQPAELMLFDPQKIWQCNSQNLRSIATNTSWLGKEIKGRVTKIWHS